MHMSYEPICFVCLVPYVKKYGISISLHAKPHSCYICKQVGAIIIYNISEILPTKEYKVSTMQLADRKLLIFL